MYLDVGGHIKNVPVAIDNTSDRFGGKSESCLRFGYWRSDAHLTEGRIDYPTREVALDNILQPRQLSQSSSIVAIDKGVGGKCWEFPVLEIAEVVKGGEFRRIEVASFQVMSMLAQRAEKRSRRARQELGLK